MGVDQARQDGLAGQSMVRVPAGHGDAGRRPDRGDAVAVDEDGAVLDHLVAVHGDDPRVGQRDACRSACGDGATKPRCETGGDGAGLAAVEGAEADAAARTGRALASSRACCRRPTNGASRRRRR